MAQKLLLHIVTWCFGAKIVTVGKIKKIITLKSQNHKSNNFRAKTAKICINLALHKSETCYEFSNSVLCFFVRQNLDAWLSRWPARIFARSLARTNCDPPSRCPFLLMEPNWHNVHWSKSRPERWWCRRKRDRIHSHILSKLISKKRKIKQTQKIWNA